MLRVLALTGLTVTALTSQLAKSGPKFPTTVEHITITGKEAKEAKEVQDMIGILRDSIDAALPDLAKATNLKLRRVLCVNVVSDVGDANYECTFRPNTLAETPSSNDSARPNTSSPLIDAIQNTGCMMSPESMPLVCDIGFNDSDLPILADRAERLFEILSEHAPIIPPFAPYLLFGVEHLECKAAASDGHAASCSMQAKKVDVPE